MPLIHRFRAASAALLALVSLVAGAAQAQGLPVVEATVGNGSKIGYVVLDFDDPGSNPEVYTFQYNYDGSPVTAAALVLLENTLTGPNGFQQTGAEVAFVTELGYNGRRRFNNFAGNNSPGDQNGFWGLWLSQTGAVGSWTFSDFGVGPAFGLPGAFFSDTPVNGTNFNGQESLLGARWHGFRWIPSGAGQAPRPAFASAIAPEPGTLALLAVGGLLLIRRRRHL